MGRRRSSKPQMSKNSSYGRDIRKFTPIARRSLPRTKRSVHLLGFEDRRTFYPETFRPAVALPRSAARFVVGKGIHVGQPNTNVSRSDSVRSSLRGSLPHTIGFEVPKSVVMCVRRKRRREVMHALGKAGRGGIGRGRKRRTNDFSEISC